MNTPTKIVIRSFAVLFLAFAVGRFVIRPLIKSQLAPAYIDTNAILTEPGFKSDEDARFKEWWEGAPMEGAPITNDPYVIVFRAIEARYTSDTNGPSTYTAYVPNGPALQMIYTNQASPAVSSITLYMTNLTAFSNRLTIY